MSNLRSPIVGRPTSVSVIVSTYNSPRWLEKTLWGFSSQNHPDFQLVVADDGSGPETSDLIRRMRAATPLSIEHVWHADDGFRKCTILNRTIEAATGEYLLFTDGDCIPRYDFVGQHVAAARPGRFLSGGYLKLPMSVSERIGKQEILSGEAFRPRWLRSVGYRPGHRALRLVARGFAAELLNRLTPTRATWNGHNASGWAADVRQVGGFDERMRYGGEDRELGERLENAGIRGKRVRFQAPCLHLDHARGYVSEEDWRRNRTIRDATVRMGRTRTEHGLSEAA